MFDELNLNFNFGLDKQRMTVKMAVLEQQEGKKPSAESNAVRMDFSDDLHAEPNWREQQYKARHAFNIWHWGREHNNTFWLFVFFSLFWPFARFVVAFV